MYDVPRATLGDRLRGIDPRRETRLDGRKLDLVKEEVLRNYIINLNTRGMPPNINIIGDIANLLTASRGGDRVGKY